MMYANSCEEVLHTEYLLGEILKRSRGSKHFLRATHVSKSWRRTARTPTVLSGFTSRNRLCFIGFILEHSSPTTPDIKLITSPADSDVDPVIELQKRFVPDVFHRKRIVGAYGGRVIVQFESGPRAGRLYSNCPYSSRPRLFKKAARPTTPMGQNLLDNRYEWFAVLPPTDGLAGGYPVCFIKDYSRDYRANHLGVEFATSGRTRVHVCVYSNKTWIPYASDLLAPASPCIFQRALYSVQSGCRIYLMYLVGLIVCFDAKTKTFEALPLPAEMQGIVEGCLEYTAGPHPEGEMVIVQLEMGRLVKWVLTRDGDTMDWNKEAAFHLSAAFGAYMNENILNSFSFKSSEWCSFQLRSISPDGRYVLISVGVIYGLFVVDMLYQTVKAYPSPKNMGRVFPLSKYWPSKP